MKKRLSWGTGIAIFIIGFLILNVIFVFFAFGEKVDLVTDNYYAQELKYQEEIDKQNKTASLDTQIQFITSESSLSFKFPPQLLSNEIKGEVHFYRPSNSTYDKIFPLELNSSGEFVIPTNSFKKGFWKIKLNWEYDSEKFFKEEKIFIN
ncbi:MAG: FixH family protein [Ignavibacteria bacterium]|jgi:nitrogen fixation protein FixH|nr:FixH family protein [Ignavibacteria bacterium]